MNFHLFAFVLNDPDIPNSQSRRNPEIPKSRNPKPEIPKFRKPDIPKTRKLPGAGRSCQELPGPIIPYDKGHYVRCRNQKKEPYEKADPLPGGQLCSRSSS